MTVDNTGIARNGFDEPKLRALTVALVADALDKLGDREQVLAPGVRPLLNGVRLVGWARTIDVRATAAVTDTPYMGEMRAIAALRAGDVAVYAVEATVRAALFGELFSLAAAAQGAVGAVLDGPVRDVRQMRELGHAVFCDGICPYDTRSRAEVVGHDVPIVCAGVPVETGDLIVGDDDGVIVVPARRVAAVIEDVMAKVTGENGAKADILKGVGVHEVWDRWRVF
ncbi:MAG: 4-hydroxy-4-methyl-2-oxoglutarate aldolase [Gaiellales bacterium]|nr:4-hydroxy-4-methyl-2-oxoglutarate aldolase [Gaiellales bacterium]